MCPHAELDAFALSEDNDFVQKLCQIHWIEYALQLYLTQVLVCGRGADKI